MKASLRSTRIAPKKANLVAKMVRGKSVEEALGVLERTNKKAARLIESLIRSAVANASQNEGQDASTLVVRTLTVNKAQTYNRGIPMARGRMRAIRKFLSHIDVTLGVEDEIEEKPKEDSSQKTKKQVKKTSSAGSADKKSTEKGAKAEKKPKQTTSSPKASRAPKSDSSTPST
jgi:large subunit ribosomal protein L22